jgi:preprotein translocase subunit SecG
LREFDFQAHGGLSATSAKWSEGMPSWAKWAVSLLVAMGLIWVGWRYPFVLVTLHVAVCFVLVIVIMLQSGSAADLAGAFGGAGSQTAFGPRGAATFLSRATTWCAVVFMLTSLTLYFKRDTAESSIGSVIEQTNPRSAPTPAPAGTGNKPAAPSLPATPGPTPPLPQPSQPASQPPAENPPKK